MEQNQKKENLGIYIYMHNQARLQQYVSQELQMFKLDLEKAEEPEIKLTTSTGS